MAPRWKMKPYDPMGTECLWERMPVWLRVVTMAGFLGFFGVFGVGTMVMLARMCAAAGKPWYTC